MVTYQFVSVTVNSDFTCPLLLGREKYVCMSILICRGKYFIYLYHLHCTGKYCICLFITNQSEHVNILVTCLFTFTYEHYFTFLFMNRNFLLRF